MGGKHFLGEVCLHLLVSHQILVERHSFSFRVSFLFSASAVKALRQRQELAQGSSMIRAGNSTL